MLGTLMEKTFPFQNRHQPAPLNNAICRKVQIAEMIRQS